MGFETKLLLKRIDGAIQVRSNVDLTFYSIVGSGLPLSLWGDGGITPFKPFFFHAFLGGLEKVAINRIFLIIPF
ncbi:hypothetical protein ACB094_11G083200 [Castanea mollissima]